MTYQLYVREDCHDCDKVIAWLKGQAIGYELVDIDRPAREGELRLFAAPALVREGRVLAYGIDIIAWLSRRVGDRPRA